MMLCLNLMRIINKVKDLFNIYLTLFEIWSFSRQEDKYY